MVEWYYHGKSVSIWQKHIPTHTALHSNMGMESSPIAGEYTQKSWKEANRIQYFITNFT